MKKFIEKLKNLRKKAKPLFASTNYNEPASIVTWRNVGSGTNEVNQFVQFNDVVRTSPAKNSEKLDERIVARPVDVYKEILTETPQIDLDNIDKKIKVVEKRLNSLIYLGINPSDEPKALAYLKARKKLSKKGSQGSSFTLGH